MNNLEELENFLDKEGRLKIWPSKRKIKIKALLYLSRKFKKGKVYTEKEVNEILNRFHTFKDPALLRRELFSYKLLNRTKDCAKYWKEK